MMFALLVISLILIAALALDKTRDIPLPAVEVTPRNRRVYTPGVVIRTRQLVRAMEARRAVRGDDGYVKSSRA
ncbi:hypothetical protein [Deinococcus sp. QL22]|uniref:hypothetical protein n=1 Tax=Deinococcus sp. QL22 TaxID=2939437 RepID=UPI0020176CF6|nr:hypothetical protein [Deinococcus sp. QL22]UQN06323.1 hypothetical protein M1R55_15910 [Deinococcus sp. QL22]